MKTNKLNILNKFKTLLSKVEGKFGRAELVDGTVVEWSGELESGSELFVLGEDGELQPAPNGTHELVDGSLVSVEDGVVTDIEVPEMEEPADEEELETEDTELSEEETVEEELQVDDMAVVEAVDTVLGLMGGEGEPLNEDTKAEVIGILKSLKQAAAEGAVEEEAEEDLDAEIEALEAELSSEEEVEAVEEIEFSDPNEPKETNTKEVELSEDNDEEDTDEVFETQLSEVMERIESISSTLERFNDRLDKVSNEPAVDVDEKKSVNNNFNKTKQKSKASRAQAILAAGK